MSNYETNFFKSIKYNSEKCVGCNRCVDICQVDVLLPNEIKGGTPVAAFPSECWYCGSCVVACPVEGAIGMEHPLMNKVHWIEKSKLVKGEK